MKPLNQNRMSDACEIDICNFCMETKTVERTYLYPSKYLKSNDHSVNTYLYNEGDYFIIVKTCIDCGIPKSE